MTNADLDAPARQDCCVVICSVPDHATALQIANSLVQEKLAACVNILPRVTSVYVWQDAIQSDEECLLFIKTLTERYPQLESHLLGMHPYELPEIIRVPISGGSSAYLQWLAHSIGMTS